MQTVSQAVLYSICVLTLLSFLILSCLISSHLISSYLTLQLQCLGERVGKNEKTRITCRLQGPGSGPPCREPAVSEEERKAMMAFYFKRQEELKKLSEANEDDYLASAWADPKQLQKSLRGTSTVRAPGV
ncbi:unnamed protein product [Choristocarpus tenellus]